ncbi:peptidase C15 [Shouchella sp. 1P09AA]|uniref:pyroglutamyl-peptidase I family protein n=1 Tax=unclassified Shouchella TaxID=2893065 RepID=UPI0039A173F2
MKPIILTGFEAFLDHEANPSQWVVGELDGKTVNGVTIKGEVLPVSFNRASETLARIVEETDPAAVVMLGLAGNRTAISLERVAINIMDGPGDNDGVQMKDCVIKEEGPAAYFSTLPLRDMEAAILPFDESVYVSNTAGTYVCNALMYETLHEMKRKNEMVPAGFIHIPITNEIKQGMPLSNDQLLQAIEASIHALVSHVSASVSK